MVTLAALLFVYCYAAAFLLLLIRSWWATYLLYGSFSTSRVWFMIRLSHYTYVLYRQTIPCVVSLAIIAAFLYGSRLPAPAFGAGVAMAVIAVFLIGKSIQPPAALFLSSSSWSAADLLVEVNVALSPMRCIAFLDPKKMHFLQRNAIADNIRARDPKLWKSIVHQLVEMVPIIILDTRGDSRAVMQEAFIVLTPRYARKTIFILDDDGGAPALQVHGIDPKDHALACVTVDELAPLLFERRTNSPRRAQWKSKTPVHENWGNVPSIVVIALPEGFDSHHVIDLALTSGKQLLLLLTPLSDIEQEAARWTLDYSWEFVHDPRLVMMIFEESLRAFVRIAFLRDVASQLPHYQARALQPPLTFEQLNVPEPVWNAVWQFLQDLHRHAEQREHEVRYVRR